MGHWSTASHEKWARAVARAVAGVTGWTAEISRQFSSQFQEQSVALDLQPARPVELSDVDDASPASPVAGLVHKDPSR